MADQVTFSTKTPARKQGRFTLSSARIVPCGDMERVGWGADRKGDQALVYESGQSQSGIPSHAVATAVASGKVIPLDLLVSAFAETGQLAKLVQQIEKASK